MTIIAATKDNRGNVYVASDTLLTDGDKRAGYAQKFTWGPGGRIIGTAGYMRTQNILNALSPLLFEKLLEKVGDVQDPAFEVFWLTDIISSVLNDMGYSQGSANPNVPDAGPRGIDMEGLYITKGRIYDMDKSLSFVEHPEFYAIGSGQDIATGAWMARRGEHPLNALIHAIDVTLEKNTSCGGDVDLNVITPRKMDDEEADAFITQTFVDAQLQGYQNELSIYVRSFS